MTPVDPWIGPRGSAASRVLQVVPERGPLTRPDLARLTGLSTGGVRPIVAALLDSGELVEGAEEPIGSTRGRGRPGKLLEASTPPGQVVAVDFGHTHVTVATADLRGAAVRSARGVVDVDRDAEGALEIVTRLAAELVAGGEGPAVRAVVGLPGPVDRAGDVRSSTIAASWWGLPVAARVGAALALPPGVVDVENDAHLGAIGEFESGAGAGRTDGIYVKASHGLGAGLILNGALYRGADGLTGEIGHAVVRPDGPLCRCGGRGCLETVVAVQRVQEQVRFVVGGDDPPDLAAAAEHPAVRRIVADAGRALGRTLADVCTLLNPQLVVLGGELAAAGEPLVEGVVESIRRYGQPAVAGTEVGLTELGERAQVVGALHEATRRARADLWTAAR